MLQEEAKRRNKDIHDILYAQKFAPRDRATKVNLQGQGRERIGKTAFNAYDAEAAAAESAAAAAAPAVADPNSPMGAGMMGMGGMGSPGGGVPQS